ncbi:MAG: hypothetical protein ACLQMF_05115 [Rectinemataceae bacterium]
MRREIVPIPSSSFAPRLHILAAVLSILCLTACNIAISPPRGDESSGTHTYYFTVTGNAASLSGISLSNSTGVGDVSIPSATMPFTSQLFTATLTGTEEVVGR